MTPEQYHSDTSRISKSGLDKINKSPAHYYHRYLSGNYVQEESLALKIGSAFHCLVLEKSEFADRYAVLESPIDKRTKDGKEAWANFIELNAGKTILTADEIELLRLMGGTVSKNESAWNLIGKGIAEQSFEWECEYTKALCKCKPDFINSDGWIIDLKTTDDASARNFAYSCRKYRYDVQAAFYLDGVEAATGVRPKGFIFIAVEKQAPFNVGLYRLDSTTIEAARDKYIENLRTYQMCLLTEDWFGLPSEVITLNLTQ